MLVGDDPASAVYVGSKGKATVAAGMASFEHRLPANRAQDATASSGYMHEAYVIKLAEGAGFKLAAKSDINANPKDTADHQGGVWALPPTYANKDVDRASYTAIGESDRMTLKFVKP